MFQVISMNLVALQKERGTPNQEVASLNPQIIIVYSVKCPWSLLVLCWYNVGGDNCTNIYLNLGRFLAKWRNAFLPISLWPYILCSQIWWCSCAVAGHYRLVMSKGLLLQIPLKTDLQFYSRYKIIQDLK